MNKDISSFLKKCYLEYLPTIRKSIPDFPKEYIFPDGNPITPVLPVQITRNKIMLIGAFPSARFERRNGKLIPVANNLSPFGEETYFDGREIRFQASRMSLNENYFEQLGINPNELWITDIVKVYLFPDKHIKNCKEIFPQREFTNTHKMFKQIAKASSLWIKEEIKLCNPSLIITLGEIPSRVILDDFKTENKVLLDGSIRDLKIENVFKVACLAHPEIRRINGKWDELTKTAIEKLAIKINQMGV